MRNNTQWKWTEREKESFSKLNEKVTEIPRLAHFDGDRDNIVTTDASRNKLRKFLRQKQTDNTIRPIEFASRYLKDAEIIYSIEE